MPISYRIDSAQKIAFTTFNGTITDKELLSHARNILSDPTIDSSFVELISAASSSMDTVTGPGIRAVAEILISSNSVQKIGIVVARDIGFGLARMVELSSDESAIEINVFRDQADARSWLGIA